MRARHVEQVPVLDSTGRLCGLHTMAQMLSARNRPNAAFILAGGKGTRLYPLTNTVPKPMVTVAGRPILERLILQLMSSGIRRFYLSVNYLAHVIVNHFGDGERFGCVIEYVHEDQPLGTGGPLSLLDPPPEFPLVVVNGDLVTQCDIGRMLDFHNDGEYVATCGLRSYTVDIPYGVAQVEGSRLTGLQEKPSHNYLVNAGIYVLSPEAIRSIPVAVEYPITELFNQCLIQGRALGAYVVEEEWIDVGHHNELQRARGEG
jgi:NDP-sugar pyrophosphorylase family protein